MAKVKIDEDVERIHVHLFKDDVEWLRQTFADRGGVANAVRVIIRKTRQQMEAAVAERTAKDLPHVKLD